MRSVNEIIKNVDGVIYKDSKTIVGTITRFDGNLVFTACLNAPDGWEQVGVSPVGDCVDLTVKDVCEIKNLFWSGDEVCAVFIPDKNPYAELRERTVNIWHKKGGELWT